MISLESPLFFVTAVCDGNKISSESPFFVITVCDGNKISLESPFCFVTTVCDGNQINEDAVNASSAGAFTTAVYRL